MNFRLENIAIAGIACAVPIQSIETAAFYDRFHEEDVNAFAEMTGVRATHRTKEEQTASDLCYVAARQLLENKAVDTATIGAVVFISQTADYRSPATAAVLHKRLGLEKDCICFDINLGCSGFVYGLSVVGALMKTSCIQNALLLVGDTCAKTFCPQDRSGIMLFGDAGSATLLTREPGKRIDGDLKTDGTGFEAIIIPAGGYRNRKGRRDPYLWEDGNIRSDYDAYMNGTDVFSFTITQVPRQIKKLMEEKGTTPENYDALVMHQANLLILQQIAKKTKFSMDKVPITIDRYGNTSGASIPLTICDAWGRQENGTVRLLLSAFGIGLSWGTVDAVLDAADIYPIIETDDYYTEGGIIV